MRSPSLGCTRVRRRWSAAQHLEGTLIAQNADDLAASGRLNDRELGFRFGKKIATLDHRLSDADHSRAAASIRDRAVCASHAPTKWPVDRSS